MSTGVVSNDRWQRRSGAALLCGVALLLLALAGRLAYVNAVLRPQLEQVAHKQQLGNAILPARRGTIFDTRGRVLATSRQKPDVFVDPLYVDDLDSLAGELGPRVNLPADEIAHKVRYREHTRFVPIAQRVDEVTAGAVRQMGSPAVGLTERPARMYPTGKSMAQVLGFVGRDGYGLEGLELQHDQHLRGENGRRSTIRDARRRAIWPSHKSARQPIDGGHIVLTIDAEIQRIAEAVLQEAVGKFEAQSGVAVVMSPHNGDVLAMVSAPTFDPRSLASSPGELRRNRAITDPTEPGSTFKPFIAAGALEGGFVSTTEKIDCHMGQHYFGRRLVTDGSPHGMMDLLGIVSKSSNIGMGTIAERMGNAELHDVIRRFGFGQRTQIGFPGENAGLVYPLERWTSYSTTSVSFGYEVAVTPLQLATAFSAMVNDGVLLKPRLVRRLLGPNGEVVESFDSPEIVRRVLATEVARFMAKEVLVAVVEDVSGSGRRAKLDDFTVLGKTGTAKLPYSDRSGYEPGAYLATFMGAAPVEDPQLVAVVMVRRPNAKIGYYGGVVSAPAVGEILEATLAYLEVPPDKGTTFAGL
ncbi:MAG: penicillin-binding protein 2 [Phycisphaerales bacterium]|nr:MAG: penicillin-binding protein 2 [Phycisphaerales bacterium]